MLLKISFRAALLCGNRLGRRQWDFFLRPFRSILFLPPPMLVSDVTLHDPDLVQWPMCSRGRGIPFVKPMNSKLHAALAPVLFIWFTLILDGVASLVTNPPVAILQSKALKHKKIIRDTPAGAVKTTVTCSKLDGVGPVDNRPSNNLLPHFVKITHDTWNMTHDTWHMTCDRWRVIHDTWQVGEGEPSSKISAS